MEAFKQGGSSTEIAALLSSSSFTEFSDRLEFVSQLAEADADLVTDASVQREELARKATELRKLEAREQAQLEHLQDRRSAAGARQQELAARLEELQTNYDRQQRILAQQQQAQQSTGGGGGGSALLSAGAIQVCPVAGPNSFVDTFGAPRSDGRTHQGQDLIAAEGTPVVAVHDGSASQSYNSLGGNSVGLTHDGGGWTYYAHLASYGQSGHVSAGTVIGYVGSTGNAGSVNHLHFEYHPGGSGSAAVNPYSLLIAVC